MVFISLGSVFVDIVFCSNNFARFTVYAIRCSAQQKNTRHLAWTKKRSQTNNFFIFNSFCSVTYFCRTHHFKTRLPTVLSANCRSLTYDLLHVFVVESEG